MNGAEGGEGGREVVGMEKEGGGVSRSIVVTETRFTEAQVKGWVSGGRTCQLLKGRATCGRVVHCCSTMGQWGPSMSHHRWQSCRYGLLLLVAGNLVEKELV